MNISKQDPIQIDTVLKGGIQRDDLTIEDNVAIFRYKRGEKTFVVRYHFAEEQKIDDEFLPQLAKVVAAAELYKVGGTRKLTKNLSESSFTILGAKNKEKTMEKLEEKKTRYETALLALNKNDSDYDVFTKEEKWKKEHSINGKQDLKAFLEKRIKYLLLVLENNKPTEENVQSQRAPETLSKDAKIPYLTKIAEAIRRKFASTLTSPFRWRQKRPAAKEEQAKILTSYLPSGGSFEEKQVNLLLPQLESGMKLRLKDNNLLVKKNEGKGKSKDSLQAAEKFIELINKAYADNYEAKKAAIEHFERSPWGKLVLEHFPTLVLTLQNSLVLGPMPKFLPFQKDDAPKEALDDGIFSFKALQSEVKNVDVKEVPKVAYQVMTGDEWDIDTTKGDLGSGEFKSGKMLRKRIQYQEAKRDRLEAIKPLNKDDFSKLYLVLKSRIHTRLLEEGRKPLNENQKAFLSLIAQALDCDAAMESINEALKRPDSADKLSTISQKYEELTGDEKTKISNYLFDLAFKEEFALLVPRNQHQVLFIETDIKPHKHLRDKLLKVNPDYEKFLTVPEPVKDVNGNFFLKSPLAKGGNLQELLAKEILNEIDLKQIAEDVKEGLKIMKRAGVYNYDLAARNVLVYPEFTKDGEVRFRGRITDWGFYGRVPDPKKQPLMWCSPERLKGESSPDTASKDDLWAFGMLLLEMEGKDISSRAMDELVGPQYRSWCWMIAFADQDGTATIRNTNLDTLIRKSSNFNILYEIFIERSNEVDQLESIISFEQRQTQQNADPSLPVANS